MAIKSADRDGPLERRVCAETVKSASHADRRRVIPSSDSSHERQNHTPKTDARGPISDRGFLADAGHAAGRLSWMALETQECAFP